MTASWGRGPRRAAATVAVAGLLAALPGCADLSGSNAERDVVLARTCLSFLARDGLVPPGATVAPDPGAFGAARREALDQGEGISTVTPLRRACGELARQVRRTPP